MTSEVFRAAVQEVFLLRSGLAFEREINRENLAMKLPGGVRRMLSGVDADLLRPAISGAAPPGHPAPPPLDLGTWSREQGLGYSTPDDDELPALTAALADIPRLRAICGLAADRLSPVLEFSSLLDSRRAMVRAQILRLRDEAAGGGEAGYRSVPISTLSKCFDLHFPSPCLSATGSSATAVLEQAVCRVSATSVVAAGATLACDDLTAPATDPGNCARCTHALSNLGAGLLHSVTRQILVPLPRRR